MCFEWFSCSFFRWADVYSTSGTNPIKLLTRLGISILCSQGKFKRYFQSLHPSWPHSSRERVEMRSWGKEARSCWCRGAGEGGRPWWAMSHLRFFFWPRRSLSAETSIRLIYCSVTQETSPALPFSCFSGYSVSSLFRDRGSGTS